LRLTDLIRESGAARQKEDGARDDVTITGITADSRAVRPGYLFAALPGLRADGRAFIAEAIGRGAVAILAPADTMPSAVAGARLIIDHDPRRRLALIAARFHAPQPKTVVAVTGTNGKSSVVTFTRQIWTALGLKAASLGTLGIAVDGEAPNVGASLTTPDAIALHSALAGLARDGVDHVAIEASSHGIAQRRLDGVRLTAAGFTNLSRDHLDYHGGMDSYFNAKARLFDTLLPEGATAVLNADSPEFPDFAARTTQRRLPLVAYGSAGRDIRLANAVPEGATAQRLDLVCFGTPFTVRLPLPGLFQAANALCALGLAVAAGADLESAVAALATLEGARGRMQLVGRLPNGAAIYVDYAHTPDALAQVLRALRDHCQGRLAVVFGCGGDRDAGKRPQMGAIAQDLADRIIVTDDNPRGENAAAIRRAILVACPEAREIGDRAEAIAAAIAELGAGDVLVIAGKGHETGQIIGGTTHPFDDIGIARRAVSARGGEAA